MAKGNNGDYLIHSLMDHMMMTEYEDVRGMVEKFPQYLLHQIAEHFGLSTTRMSKDGEVPLTNWELWEAVNYTVEGWYPGQYGLSVHEVDVVLKKEDNRLNMYFYRMGRLLHTIHFDKDVTNWQYIQVTDENSGKSYSQDVYLSLSIVYGQIDQYDDPCFCFVPVKITTHGEVILLGKEHWYKEGDLPESYLAWDIQKQGFSEVEPPAYCR